MKKLLIIAAFLLAGCNRHIANYEVIVVIEGRDGSSYNICTTNNDHWFIDSDNKYKIGDTLKFSK